MKITVRKLLKDELIKDAVIVFIGTTIVGFLNLLYQLVSVRLLTPSSYGTLNALVSLVMFVSMTVSPLGPAFVRFFTEYITKKDFATLKSISKKLIKRLTIAGFVLFFLFTVFSHPLASFFKTQVLYIVVCGIIVGTSLISLIFPALFQSFQKFKTYSLLGIISSFGKLLVGTVLMYMGWSALGALSGYLAAPLIVLMISLFMILKVYRGNIDGVKPSKSISLIPIYKYFFPVAAVMFSFTVLTNIDVVLVKHFFPSLQAGYYSVAQIVGKIFLFLPSALSVVIFPKSTASYVTNSHSHSILYKSLAIAAVICGVGVAFCFFFPAFLLKILTAHSNSASTSLVGLFSLAMSFYALVWIIINYLLATHNLKLVFPLMLFSLMETLTVWFYHPNLPAILWILTGFSLLTFTAGLVAVSKAGSKKEENKNSILSK